MYLNEAGRHVINPSLQPNSLAQQYSPHVHLLPVDFVVVKVEQVDGAGHAFVAVFVALHHAAVVQQALEQPRHGRDERRARLAPRGILRLDAFQQAEGYRKKHKLV